MQYVVSAIPDVDTPLEWNFLAAGLIIALSYLMRSRGMFAVKAHGKYVLALASELINRIGLARSPILRILSVGDAGRWRGRFARAVPWMMPLSDFH